MNGVPLFGQRVGASVNAIPTNFAQTTATFIPIPNNPHVFIAGGLTKRQWMATQFLSAMIQEHGILHGDSEEHVQGNVDCAIIDCLLLADSLLKATESASPSNGKSDNEAN